MSYAARTCRTCGAHFNGLPFHYLCKSCFKTKMETERYREMFDAREQGYRAGYAAGAASALPANVVQDAIRLTHPDRHPVERVELATRVTQELLALRDARRR